MSTLSYLYAAVLRLLSVPLNFIHKLFDSSVMEHDYLRLQQEVCRLHSEYYETSDALREQKMDTLQITANAQIREKDLINKVAALESSNIALTKRIDELVVAAASSMKDYVVACTEIANLDDKLSYTERLNKKQAEKLSQLRKKHKKIAKR